MTSRGSAFFPRASYTQLGVSWSVENTSSPIISSVIIRGRRRLGSPGRPQKKKTAAAERRLQLPFVLFFFPTKFLLFHGRPNFFFLFSVQTFYDRSIKNKKILFRHWRRPFSLLPWPFDPLFFFLRRPKYICTLDCRQMAIVSVSELESAASGLAGFYLFSG